MTWIDHPLRKQMCPHCGHVVNRAGDTEGTATAPKPGDLLVCIRCAGVAEVTISGFPRAVDGAEVAEMTKDNPELARYIAAVRQLPEP